MSGSLQGAGGVGGLILASDGTTTAFAAFDGNGNVGSYVSAGTGASVAHYDYNAYSEKTAAEGSAKDAFAYGFSTKRSDSESGMVYYGFRYYQPLNGRWLSRDPLEENGGVNLYGFCNNDGVGLTDSLGLALTAYSTGSARVTRGVGVTARELASTIADWKPSVELSQDANGAWRVSLTGRLQVTIYVRTGVNVNSVPYSDGRSVIQHGNYHEDVWARWWAEFKRAADPVEGTYCNKRCAELAKEAAEAIGEITSSSANAENQGFDWTVYGRNLPVNDPERQRIQGNYDSSIQYINYQRSLLDRVEQRWRSRGCSKTN